MGFSRDAHHNHEKKRRRQRLLSERSERRLAGQADMIGFWQLREDGLDAEGIDSLIEAGMLRPVPGRVLTTRRSPLDQDARRWSALLSGGPGARLASLSALDLIGVKDTFTDPVHIVVRGSAPRKTAGVRRHRTAVLDDLDCVRREGYPATSVALALVHAAADSTVDALASYLDRAVMLGEFSGDALQRVMAARGSFRGKPALLEALSTLDATTGRFRSEFERRLRRLIAMSSVLPEVEVNPLVDAIRPDFRFVGSRAILECDGRDYHRSPSQVLADAERERRLEAMGFLILRLRWAQLVYEPERTLARIEAFVLANLVAPEPR